MVLHSILGFMKDIVIPDKILQDHLAALAPDAMDTFLLSRGEEKDALRGAVVNASNLVNEMRTSHDLGILETLILGQAYIGALLMTMSLKGRARIQLDIGCAGPVKGLSVEASAAGAVRGYLKQTPIPLEDPLESFDTSPFFGPGILTVSRFADGAVHPFTGNIDLHYGNIGQDIAHYYLVSEQTRTSVSVSIKFDNSGRVIGAGGLFIEALPFASEEILDYAESAITGMKSIGEGMSRGHAGPDIAAQAFTDFTLAPLQHHSVRFHCPCTRERFTGFLKALKKEELKDMAEHGPFPVVTICHNCNSTYEYDKEEILGMLKNKAPNSADS